MEVFYMELKNLICAIEQADGYIVEEIILALQRRYQKLYPEWEIQFISVPREDSEERKRILERILQMEDLRK